jgi:hypothetical protein
VWRGPVNVDNSLMTEHLLFPAVAFLGALIGGYISSYAKKRAETRALKKDIREIARQTEIITKAAKEIEAGISIRVWSQQQRWDVQKTTLLESLKELATVETFLHELVFTFRDTKGHAQGYAERREKAGEKYADAINSFRRTQLAMEIVCGVTIGKRFREIDNIFARTLHAAKRSDFDEIWNDLSLELPAAKTALRETIRRQLEFDPQLGGGELSLSNSAPLEEN